jgi:hypothetical protein
VIIIPTFRAVIAKRSVVVPPFSPSDLPDMIYWFDSSDSSTLFNATSGGSLPGDGQIVKRWEDKSGNGWHFTQGTDSAAPTRAVAAVNGLDAVGFGTGKIIANSGFSGQNGVTTLTRYMVLATESLPASQVADNSNSAGVIQQYQSTNMLSYMSPGNYAVVNGAAQTGVYIFASVIGYTDGTTFADRLKLYKDGSFLTHSSTAGSPPSAAASSNGMQLGFSAGNSWLGAIMEVIAYDAKHSDTDRETVEAYLADKWGVTL